MPRDYRREYDAYYGKRGNGPRTAKQKRHRKEKTARNDARGRYIEKYGKKALKGLDVHHKNGDPLSNGDKNLMLLNIAENRASKGK